MVPDCPDCGVRETECVCDETTKLKRRIRELESEVKTLNGALDGWRRRSTATNEDHTELRAALEMCDRAIMHKEPLRRLKELPGGEHGTI